MIAIDMWLIMAGIEWILFRDPGLGGSMCGSRMRLCMVVQEEILLFCEVPADKVD